MAEEDADGWTYPVGHIYQPTMVEFMSFFHGAVEYPDDAVFTKEQLLEIQPIDMKRYLCIKAYNDPDPDIDNGARPANGPSDSLYYRCKESSIQVHAVQECQLGEWTREPNKVGACQ
jgi:hypothetical protein